MSTKKTLFVIAGIILASIAIIILVYSTEPEAQFETATKKTAMLVDIEKVRRGNFKPTVVATGTVQPAKDVTLSPRVMGEIVDISEKFVPGSYVRKGEVLMQIDPSDYQNTLRLRESDLQLAKADLKVEMGRQDVAQKDYELIGADELSSENKALVLREPQLEQARANVEAAEAAVRQARLNLQRTTIRAPFDAHIISRNTNVGSQVNVGDNLGRIVGMDEYWVVANVPLAKINWLTFSEGNQEAGTGVKIMNESSWPSGQYREGRLFRMIGALDNQTRLARVIVSVKDPLVRMTEDNAPPLMIGTFVEAEMEAEELQNVVKLSRDHLRKDETVWLMKNGKLSIRNVDILFEDADYAYVSSGLEDQDSVVTTNLSTVVEGSPLRLEGQERNTQAAVNQ